MEKFLDILSSQFPMITAGLSAGIMVFARVLGFIRFAPIFNRKEINSIVKIALTLIFTVILVISFKPVNPPSTFSPILGIILNFAVGAMIGYMAQLVLIAVEAGADMMNMQMGLSSAMVLDPTTSSQTSILGRFFAFLGILIFIQVGGLYWILRTLIKSFSLFPMYASTIPLEQIVNMEYLIHLSSNVLFMGLQTAAPILLATLGQDIILGVISKTAPQVNVFQLSFLFKPVLGAAIMVWILPMMVNIITDYFNSFAAAM